MAFIVSSPLINPNLFILTAGAFGYEMAIARVFSAIILGISAGITTQFLLQKGWLQSGTILNPNYIGQIDTTAYKQSENKTNLKFRQFISLFSKELWKMTKYICKYFFLAIFIAAIVKIIIPVEWIETMLGGNSFLSVLVATGAGIPFYTCGGAVIPVVQALSEMGMSKGAILAFFISGPATGISNLVIMKAAFNFKLLLIYLFVNLIGALILGMIYNFY
jgi:uncharacterized protein